MLDCYMRVLSVKLNYFHLCGVETEVKFEIGNLGFFEYSFFKPIFIGILDEMLIDI